MNKYSVLKLSNGEDIVCRVVEASKERIKIEDIKIKWKLSEK